MATIDARLCQLEARHRNIEDREPSHIELYCELCDTVGAEAALAWVYDLITAGELAIIGPCTMNVGRRARDSQVLSLTEFAMVFNESWEPGTIIIPIFQSESARALELLAAGIMKIYPAYYNGATSGHIARYDVGVTTGNAAHLEEVYRLGRRIEVALMAVNSQTNQTPDMNDWRFVPDHIERFLREHLTLTEYTG